MALPQTLNPSAPAGSDAPSLGDDEFRSLKTYIIDVFGVPNNSAVTSAAFAITAAGVVTVSQSPFYVPTYVLGGPSGILKLSALYTSMELQVASNTIMQVTATGVLLPSHMLRVGGQLRTGVNSVDVTTPTGMLDATKLTLPNERRGDLLHRSSGGWSGLRPGVSGLFLQSAGVNADAVWADPSVVSPNWAVCSIEAIFDGAGSVLNSGIRLDVPIDFNGTINQATLVGYPTGSLVVDVYKTAYAAYPGSTGQSITASAKPTLTNAIKYQDATLTGWTTAITAGDILRYNIDSVSSAILATLALKVTRT